MHHFLQKILFLSLLVFLSLSVYSATASASEISGSWTKKSTSALTHPSGVASDPSVIKDGSLYRMVYTCLIASADKTAICESISIDGGTTWVPVTTKLVGDEPTGMVLRGETGAWDEHLESASLIKQGDVYFLYYAGYVKGGMVNRASIGLATSKDGVTFTKLPSAVLAPTANSYDNDALFSPTVIVLPDTTFAMLYAGHSYCATCGSTIGVQILGATSPNGYVWTKLPNPVLRGGAQSWVQDGIAEPAVVAIDGSYHLFITGIQGDARTIGIARSATVFGPYMVSKTPSIIPGPSAYDAVSVLAPSVLVENNMARVWYLAYPKTGIITVGYTQSPLSLQTSVVTLSAGSTTIAVGQSTSLVYSSSNVTSCVGTGFTPTGVSGSVVVTPTVTTTYTIVCTGPNGSVSATSTVSANTLLVPQIPPQSVPQQIQANARVKTTASLNVRRDPSIFGKKVCQQRVGTLGTVVAGPQNFGGYTWWKIDYDMQCDGWSVQNYLALTPTTQAYNTPSSVPVITHTLAKTWTGEEVITLQGILTTLGYFTEEATGYFGDLTEMAVKEFQKANNVAAVGIVGPQTRMLLQEVGQ